MRRKIKKESPSLNSGLRVCLLSEPQYRRRFGYEEDFLTTCFLSQTATFWPLLQTQEFCRNYTSTPCTVGYISIVALF
jgi:hypothetical protein